VQKPLRVPFELIDADTLQIELGGVEVQLAREALSAPGSGR